MLLLSQPTWDITKEIPESSLSPGDEGNTDRKKYTLWRVFGQLTGAALIHSSQVTSKETGCQKQKLTQKQKEKKKTE